MPDLWQNDKLNFVAQRLSVSDVKARVVQHPRILTADDMRLRQAQRQKRPRRGLLIMAGNFFWSAAHNDRQGIGA